ncbi:MAG TPA: hypothetical protein VIT44_10850, partial [Cyclobacteriaceae bacterium]
SVHTFAQSTAETALLFGRVRPAGSARIQAMGGAQTSLGGDYSSAVSNPAGLGMFNRSEFTITPGLNLSKTSSDYLNNTSSDSKSNVHLPGLSLVFHSAKDKNGLLAGSFAISFSRLNSFTNDFNYSGTNSNNSIIDYFIHDATGLSPSSLKPGGDYFNNPTGLAYNNYLIEDSTFFDPGARDDRYASVLGTFPNNPNDIRTVLQAEEVKTSGKQNQMSLSYGANFIDKIFIGAGFGISTLRYETSKTYRESNFHFDLDPDFNPLGSMELREDLRISGSGINASLGIIARPIDMLQLGLSFNTPTLYQLTDTYSSSMDTKWNNFDYYGNNDPLNDESEQTDIVTSEYTLKTPGRLNLGATVFINESGFISGDVEFVKYSGAKYSAETSGISYDEDNDEIKNLYQSTVNYRIGGEYRYQKFRARAGGSFMPDPFKDQQNGINQSITTITGGLGYRSERFYIDLAVIFANGQTSYRPYSIPSANSPLVINSNNMTTAMVTLGFPF